MKKLIFLHNTSIANIPAVGGDGALRRQRRAKIYIYIYIRKFVWYQCYYPHRSKDFVSPICRIFFVPPLTKKKKIEKKHWVIKKINSEKKKVLVLLSASVVIFFVFLMRDFHWIGALGRFSHRSVMSRCLYVCLWRLETPSSGGRGDLCLKGVSLILS